jgi:DNA-binding transcriptional regulator YhcF (GntR family)
VKVYAGKDPLTGREIRFRQTCKTQLAAQIELGKLLEQVTAGRQPESGATVAQLLDQYAQVAEWDLTTRTGFEGYIRRTIKPALGHMQVRKVRGPVLDMFYARLKKCGDLACNGRPFTEHRNVPVLTVKPAGLRPAWQQVADALREAIQTGVLPPGALLPSMPEPGALQGLPMNTLKHAFSVLAEEGLIVVRQGRTAVVAGDPPDQGEPGRRLWRPGPGHDCQLSGCRPHVCRPMKAATIRQIHSILSGAFAAAQRWEWVDGNPADSARPPTARPVKQLATPPSDGSRRGELCAVQVCDLDLDRGNLHIRFNYVVRGGQRIRKDTKTHQERFNAIDPITCALIREHLAAAKAALAAVGHQLPADAYLFSNDPMHAAPWNPDWASHKVGDLAAAVEVKLNIKGLRHYTASQLLAARFDLRNTAARLGHSGGGRRPCATTLTLPGMPHDARRRG